MPISGTFNSTKQDIADPETRDQAPENVRVLRDQLRSGHNAVDHQRAEQQRHHRVAGNAEAHGRDEIALHRRVGRGFRAGHAFERSGAEPLGRLRDTLFGRVGDERRDGRAGAGNQRAQTADQRAAQHRENRQLEIGFGRPQIAEADFGISGADRRDLVDAVHELGDAEQAERQRDELDAVVELGQPERVTLGAESQDRCRHSRE